jgi:hypothetical protein
MSRDVFKRAKRRLEMHLYFVYFGGLIFLFLGGAVISIADRLGIFRGADGKLWLAIGTLVLVGGPIALPFAIIRHIRKSDVIPCPECKTNLLKDADRVMKEGRCYKCGRDVLN